MTYRPQDPNNIEDVTATLDAANEALEVREDRLRELEAQLASVREVVAA